MLFKNRRPSYVRLAPNRLKTLLQKYSEGRLRQLDRLFITYTELFSSFVEILSKLAFVFWGGLARLDGKSPRGRRVGFNERETATTCLPSDENLHSFEVGLWMRNLPLRHGLYNRRLLP
ncbi:MAG: hypothetical protein QOF63_1928 [Thermoanaerobaculia bacterium]|nr:hypothetical protein [Thermoanaerobaculia bacterium]